MKFCSKCGTQNEDSSKLCKNCGEKLYNTNDHNHTNNTNNTSSNQNYNVPMKFCQYCGEKVSVEAQICPKCPIVW